MSAADRFAVIMTGIGVIISGIAWALRTLLGIQRSWDRTNARLDSVVDSLKDIAAASEKNLGELARQVRDDRAAVNERLVYLERNAVMTRGAVPPVRKLPGLI